jgi:hypothetical protein
MPSSKHKRLSATKSSTTVILSVLTLALATAPAYADSSCGQKQEANKDGLVSGFMKGIWHMDAHESKDTGRKRQKASVRIQAAPDIVWRSIHEERKHDPELEYSKIVEQKENETTIEQKFKDIPFVGSSVCVLNSKEILHQRIDYSLVKSDHFKALEGSWILTPVDSGKATILELTSYVDSGTPVPRMFVEQVMNKKLQKRVGNVKKLAEAEQVRLAHKGQSI